jgi:hypothetical protein
MKIVELKTTDGTKVEINPNAVTEIVKVQNEESGFLFFPGREAEYEIHMTDQEKVRVDQSEHDKLKEA